MAHSTTAPGGNGKAGSDGRRPEALRVIPANVPDALKALDRWVVWKYVSELDPDTGGVEYDKPPFNARTGNLASSTNPKTWSSWEEAWDAYEGGGWDGVGFVLHRPKGDGAAGLVGLDLDDCRDPQTGELSADALATLTALDTYAEVSPSGTGVRAFALGKLPPHGRKKGDFEVYETARYVTVTGQRVEGWPRTAEPRQEALEKLHRSVFGEAPPPPPGPGEGGGQEGNGCPEDEAVLRHARACPRSGARFRKLYDEGDWSDFGSQSEADLSLVNDLVYWCGRPASLARVDRLFRGSGLYRPKWEREDYRRRTFEKAVNGRTSYHQWPVGEGGKAAPADHLVYEEGGLTARVRKREINKTRHKWEVALFRGQEHIGGDVIDPAAKRERDRLLCGLGGASDDEKKAAERLLLRLWRCVEDDWKAHAKKVAEWEHAEYLRRAEEARAQADARLVEALRELEALARPLLADPALLYRVGEALRARGLVRESENGLLVYLAEVSQVTDEPVSVVVKGESAAGKSHLVKVAVGLAPERYHYDVTSMSERALVYNPRPYAHRTVVIYEAHGQGGEDSISAYLIRSLISEGRIKHWVVVDGQTVEVVKEGPTNFITTTTRAELHAENETRICTLLVDESPEQTEAVLKVQAAIAAGAFLPADASDFHAVFDWLHLAGAKAAVIPFAPALVEMMPKRPLRLRRDFPRLLGFVRTCALLHQEQRGRDEAEKVVAEPADYAIVRALVGPTFGRAVRGITEKTAELVKALEKVLEEKDEEAGPGLGRATYGDLVKKTGHNKMYVSRWLRPALDLGLVENDHAGQKGKEASLHLGQLRADAQDVLPTPEQLADKLGVAIRWTCPLTGATRDTSGTATGRNGSGCYTPHFPQHHAGAGDASENGAGVTVEQCNEGGGGSCGAHADGGGDHPATVGGGITGAHEGPPPLPLHCSTVTPAPPAVANPVPGNGSGNCPPYQSEVIRSGTPRRTYRKRCAYCGGEFVVAGSHARTCSNGCRRKLCLERKGAPAAVAEAVAQPDDGHNPDGSWGPDVWTPWDEGREGGPARRPLSAALPLPDPIPLCDTYSPPPLKWFGGKGNRKSALARSILALGGPHEVYVEPFAGGLSVLLAKPRSAVEVAGDLDAELVNFWLAVRDDCAALLALLPETFTTEAELGAAFGPARAALAAGGGTPTQRAAWFFTINRASRGGLMEDAYPQGVRARRGKPEAVSAWESARAALPLACARLAGVALRHAPAPDLLRAYDSPDALVYADPPYLHDTRVAGSYAHEMDDAAHAELLGVLSSLRAEVLLSGYRSALYDRLLAGWARYEKAVTVEVAGGARKNGRVECVWHKPRGR